ncbi:MAG: MarR family transcriptional regulator [Flavobacteriales bacterium]|nr:MarR family transcriptional regulator [Flavobacteriales bacterium]
MKIEEAIKQNTFKNNIQKALVNLVYTGNWLRDIHEKTFKTFDLLPQHFNVLRILKGKHPNPVSPGEIKEVMLDKGHDLTRLLDKLVKQGLVNRKTCNENRRKIDITLTEKGLSKLEEMNKSLDNNTLPINHHVSEKEALLLSDLLDKLRG